MAFTSENYVVAKLTVMETEIESAHALLDVKKIRRQDPEWGRLTLSQRIMLSLGESLPERQNDENDGYSDG